MTTIPESTWEEARAVAKTILDAAEACSCDQCVGSAVEATAHALHRARQEATEKGWQLIETAPRDWTNIILFDPEHWQGVFEGYYSCADGGSDCWMEHRGPGSDKVEPTHWRPLPEPPTVEATHD